MISFLKVSKLILSFCAITTLKACSIVLVLLALGGCISTKEYKKDLDATTQIMWNYYHKINNLEDRIMDVELEQIKRILEERIDLFERSQPKEFFYYENDLLKENKKK